MGKVTELQIYSDTEKVFVSLMSLVANMPKISRGSIGANINRVTLDMIHDIMNANRTKGIGKLPFLDDFMNKTEELMIDLRLCLNCHFFNMKKFNSIIPNLERIRNQAVKWKNYINNKNQNK